MLSGKGADLFSGIHDAACNLTAVTFPDGATRTFVYDAGHLLTAHTGERGNRSVLTYDAAGVAARCDPARRRRAHHVKPERRRAGRPRERAGREQNDRCADN